MPLQEYSEPGKGRIKIILPASEKAAELFNVEYQENDWQGSGTVMLVDDEETVHGRFYSKNKYIISTARCNNEVGSYLIIGMGCQYFICHCRMTRIVASKYQNITQNGGCSESHQ